MASLALLLPVGASGQPSASLMQLGSLFERQSVQMQADLCSKRFPASATAWNEVSAYWTQRYAVDLSKLNASAMQLMSVLEALPANARPLNLSDFLVAFQSQGVTLVIYGLAGAPDDNASLLCNEMRAALIDDDRVRQGFLVAQAAVDEAIRAVK